MSQDGTKEITNLFSGKIFPFPKPTSLVKFLCKICTGKDDIILDFFSGSSTTAQSVMELNYEDNANRKFIMIQLSELLDKSSEAHKLGYINLCQLGKERIRRAGDKIKSEHPEADIDIGFKVFRTADTNIKWNSLMDMGQVDMNQLEYTPDLVDFMPDANDVDVVYELMLRQRDVALSETLEQLSDIGSRTYLYASSYLVCMETQITEEMVGKLAELDPLPIKFIFRDSAFKDDIALKDETFRRLKALIEKNAGTNKPTYTVEFI
jgi:adenine-specific DNA-methyltransferase